MSGLRIVVVGDESLTVQCAEQLLERGHQITCLVTSESPLVQWAMTRDIPTVAPGADLNERVEGSFDYLLSIANLRMLPTPLLERAEVGAVNFHDGPLPKYAGLNAPIWALLANEPQHGVTWHVMLAEADTGNVLVQEQFDLQPDDTALTVNARCYEVALASFATLAPLLESRDLSGSPQDLSQRTYFARKHRPDQLAVLDFSRSAEDLARTVRALDFGQYDNPLSRPKILTARGVVYVGAAQPLPEQPELPPGQCGPFDETSWVVGTATCPLRLSRFSNAQGQGITPQQAVAEVVGDTQQPLSLPDSLDSDLAFALPWLAHEPLWAARARRFEATEAPLANWSPPDNRGGEQPASGHHVLAGASASPPQWFAAFALWLSRMNGVDRVCLLAGDSGRQLGSAQWLFAPLVPSALKVDAHAGFEQLVKQAEKELEQLNSKGSYCQDLPTRVRDVPALQADVGIQLRAAEASAAEPAVLGGRKMVLAIADGAASLQYDPASYRAQTVETAAAQILQLLQAAQQEPHQPVGQLPLITDSERALLFEQFNATQVSPPADWPQTVQGGLEAQAERTPDRIACVFEGKELSYRTVNQRANELAARLVEQGVTRDTLVGVHLPRCEDLLIAVLGILKAGGAYLPLDPAYPAERLQHMLHDSGATRIVTRPDVAPQFSTTAQSVMVGGSEAPPRDVPNPSVAVAPEQLAYVIYTSGSTGKPKGVMLEHRQVTNFFLGMDDRVPRFEDNCWLAVTSLSFDISVLELLWTLGRGFKVVLAPESRADLSREVGVGGLKLDFSLFYFSSDASVGGEDKYRLLLEGARFADANDFVAVWTPERHFDAFGGLYPNPAVTGAAVAAVTKNVKIRAGSCVTPLHNPIRIAEEWAVVDCLSAGRAGISLAAGWHPHDFVLRPENFKDRKRVMIQNAETLRQLWRGESVAMTSPVGDIQVKTLPRPVRGDIPLWLTSASNVETFEMAAQLRAGVLTHLLGQSLEELRGKISAYRREWKRCGHEGEGHIVLMLHTYVGTSDAEAKEVVRQPMKTYLSSALSLIAEHAWSFPAFKRVARSDASLTENFNNLSPEDTDALLDYSFERYYETAGLFGSPERCQQTLREVHASGIDEVACLIDFGVDTDAVLEQLPRLNQVRIAATQPVQTQPDDFSLAAQIHRHKVTHLQCTPSMAQMLLLNEGSQAALGQVRTWMLGGEALPPSLVREIRKATGAKLLNMYGPTETTVWSSTDTVNNEAVTLGKPIANTQLYVLDERGQLLPPGAPGELFIGGEGVARGYFERPDLNAERFLKDPFAGNDRARMYKTGDRVCFNHEGKLSFLGRLDHQVKLRGHRIELGEIENALCRQESIREAVVIVREDSPRDFRLVAYYLAQKGHKPDAQHLKRALSDALPEAMVPAHYVQLPQFPLTPNAKVDRKALPAPVASAAPESSRYDAPSGELEATITGVWQEILGVPQVGATDNVFEQGGHSLLVVQVHRKLSALVSAPLSITDLFRYPTARSLAEHLGGQNSSDRASETKERASARKDAMERRSAMRRNRRG